MEAVNGRIKQKFCQCVGAGLKLLRHLQVGVNYNIGASKLGDMIVDSSEGKLRSGIRKNSWQVSLAYMF